MTPLGQMRKREAELWRAYPEIDWLRPQKVVVTREVGRPTLENGWKPPERVVVERITCRFCTAMNGLGAVNLERDGFGSVQEFQEHQEREHFDG